MKYMSVVLLIVALSGHGCSDYREYVEEDERGAFLERSHRVQHLKTYETGVRFDEFCNLVTKDCYRHELINRVRWTYSPKFLKSGFLALSYNNRNGKWLGYTQFEIYQTVTGVRVPCGNCDDSFERPESFSVLDSSNILVGLGGYFVEGESRERIYVLEISAKSYNIQLIDEHRSEVGSFRSMVKTEGSSIYWIDCSEHCKLVEHDTIRNERIVRPVPECQGKRKIELRRKGADRIPRPRCYNEDSEVW